MNIFMAFVFSVDDLGLTLGIVVVEPSPSEESRDREDEPSLIISGSGCGDPVCILSFRVRDLLLRAFGALESCSISSYTGYIVKTMIRQGKTI